MKCFSPQSIPDPRLNDVKARITIPCGKCAACIANKRNDWATRLRIEASLSKSAYFITLTYSDDAIKLEHIVNKYGKHLYTHGTLVKKDFQLFMKKLRKGLKNPIKYYTVGEYGTKTNRPHYHMLLFNIELEDWKLYKYLLSKWTYKDKNGKMQPMGTIDIGTVTPASIRYVTKYMIQKQNFQNPYIEPPFSLMSQGLGKGYLKKKAAQHHQDLNRNYVVFEDGQKSRLPRYLREKLYSENTREKQNEYFMRKEDKEELSNIEKWYKENRSKNWFEHEQEKKTHFEEMQNKRLKTNKF